jgi:hypothetical protein
MDATLSADAGWAIPAGTPVYDAAGAKLGTVRAADADALLVARGFRFVTDSEVPLDEVARDEDGKLFPKRTKAEVAGTGGD